MKIINIVSNKFYSVIQAIDEEIEIIKNDDVAKMRWSFGVLALSSIFISVMILGGLK